MNADSGAMDAILSRLAGGLVVSCQSDAADGLGRMLSDVSMATRAVAGGAVGIRTNGVASVAAIRSAVELPIIGIVKTAGPRRRHITVDDEQVRRLACVGADLIAVEFTAESGTDDPDRLARFRREGLRIMADVSTEAEGIAAWRAGAQVVATTLSGYTPYSAHAAGPAIDLVARLAMHGITVIAEGRYATTEDVRQAFAAGALAVVAGGAITDPAALTRRLAAGAPRARADGGGISHG